MPPRAVPLSTHGPGGTWRGTGCPWCRLHAWAMPERSCSPQRMGECNHDLRLKPGNLYRQLPLPGLALSSNTWRHRYRDFSRWAGARKYGQRVITPGRLAAPVEIIAIARWRAAHACDWTHTCLGPRGDGGMATSLWDMEYNGARCRSIPCQYDSSSAAKPPRSRSIPGL